MLRSSAHNSQMTHINIAYAVDCFYDSNISTISIDKIQKKLYKPL